MPTNKPGPPARSDPVNEVAAVVKTALAVLLTMSFSSSPKFIKAPIMIEVPEPILLKAEKIH